MWARHKQHKGARVAFWHHRLVAGVSAVCRCPEELRRRDPAPGLNHARPICGCIRVFFRLFEGACEGDVRPFTRGGHQLGMGGAAVSADRAGLPLVARVLVEKPCRKALPGVGLGVGVRSLRTRFVAPRTPTFQNPPASGVYWRWIRHACAPRFSPHKRQQLRYPHPHTWDHLHTFVSRCRHLRGWCTILSNNITSPLPFCGNEKRHF